MSEFEHYRRDLLPSSPPTTPPTLEPAHVQREPAEPPFHPPPSGRSRLWTHHPNFWFAWMWMLVFFGCQLAAAVVMGVVILLRGIASGDWRRYVARVDADPAVMAEVTWPGLIVQFLLMITVAVGLMWVFNRGNMRRAYAWRLPSPSHFA